MTDLALVGVWAEYEGRLRDFLRGRLGDSYEADEVLQDVLLKAARGIETMRDPAKLQSWLFQIARNALIDRGRKAQRDRARFEQLSDHLGTAGEEDVEALAVRIQLASCVRPFVERMSDPYRAAVRAVDLEGVRQVDVARELDVPLSTVKSRVQRGRKMLRDLFAECCLFGRDARGRVVSQRPRAGRCGCS